MEDYLEKRQKFGGRSKAVLVGSVVLLTLVCLVGAAVLLSLPESPLFRMLLILVFIGWLVGLLYLLPPLFVSRKYEANFIQGKNGEDEVADTLSQLPQGFSVFHDVHFGKGGNIDFVVTGSCGVVAVEVKNYRVGAEVKEGKLFLAGKETRAKEAHQAFRSAMAIKEFLENKVTGKVYVTAMLVFTSELKLAGLAQQVGNVSVTSAQNLNHALASLKGFVKLEELEKINRVLALIARRQIL